MPDDDVTQAEVSLCRVSASLLLFKYMPKMTLNIKIVFFIMNKRREMDSGFSRAWKQLTIALSFASCNSQLFPGPPESL